MSKRKRSTINGLTKMPNGDKIALELKTSKIGSCPMESSGSSSLKQLLSKNPLFGSMQNRVATVKQLRKIQGRLSSLKGKNYAALGAFHQDFQKICKPDTFLALTGATEEVTALPLAMTLFWEYVNEIYLPTITPIERRYVALCMRSLMMEIKIENSILDRCETAFGWTPSDVNPTVMSRIMPHYKSQLGNWVTAYKAIIIPPVGRGIQDQLFINQYQTGQLSFEYIIKSPNGKIWKRAPASSFEHAAEKAYHSWFEMYTEEVVKDALTPKKDKTVTLIGGWIDEEEFFMHKLKYQGNVIPHFDDTRDCRRFVLGAGHIHIDDVIIQVVTPRIQDPLGQELFLKSGHLLKMSLDWRIKKPEQYIQGEVICKKCGVIGKVQTANMLYVHGFGLTCSPCIDYMTEHGSFGSDGCECGLIDHSMYDQWM